MRVERIHPARLGDERLEVAVVIDVLRATSTAAVLLGRGAPALGVVSTPGELAQLAAQCGRCLVVSELEETAAWGERIDNSPTIARGVVLAGRTPVLVTTNGTRALAAAAARAERVLLASFLNLRAVARYLVDRAPGKVTLLPAGHFARAESRAEDDLCAEAIAALLRGEAPDLAAFAARSRDDERVRRRIAREPGFSDDVDLALTPDLYSIVPEFRAAGDGAGWVRTCAAGA